MYQYTSTWIDLQLNQNIYFVLFFLELKKQKRSKSFKAPPPAQEIILLDQLKQVIIDYNMK